jgi:hypothetical protein
MERAARDAAASGGMGGFEQAVRQGVSANLCDAVAGLSAASPEEGLDIRIAWSRTRPAANTVPSRIVLGSDSIPLIQEAARLFKETAPVEDVELQGFVTRLARGPTETSGEVTLEGLVDGQLRRAIVELGEGIYLQAVQAHEQRRDRLKPGGLPCQWGRAAGGAGHRVSGVIKVAVAYRLCSPQV